MFWLAKDEELVKKYVEGISGNIHKNIEKEQNKKCLSKVCNNILNELLDKNSEFFYEKILAMQPDEMMDFYELWKKRFGSKGHNIYGIKSKPGMNSGSSVSKMLKRIFDYQEFSRKTCNWEWNAYKFTEALGVTICPYCGRQFIDTIIGKKVVKGKRDLQIVRAELDHYIPKAKFPMFALSFYNLIPSCHFCNSSIKNVRELSIKKHIHPYIESVADFRFTYKPVNKEVQLIYENDQNNKVKNTCEFFYTEDIYQFHKGIADDYYQEAKEFSKSLLMDYHEFMKNNANPNISRKEIFYRKFRISENTDDEIIGKFRKDIVEELIKIYGEE